MFNAGLFINDLSMHDSSRDLVLAGTQQSAELKLALDQVMIKRFFFALKVFQRTQFLLGETEEYRFGRKYEEIRCRNEENRFTSLPNDSEKYCRSITKWRET